MNKSAKYILVAAIGLSACGQGQALAYLPAGFHIIKEGPGSNMVIWFTNDCERIDPPAVTRGWVYECMTIWLKLHDVWGENDTPVNDLELEFEDWGGSDKYWVTDRIDDQWEMIPLAPWLEANLEDQLVAPGLGDDTGTFEAVYSGVNLQEWLADTRPMQDTYDIVDGECPDLPGYLIGTTPFVFNPNAGENENPHSTTPLTGTLIVRSEATFGNPPVPAVSEGPLIAMTVLVLAAGTIVIGWRRRRPAAG